MSDQFETLCIKGLTNQPSCFQGNKVFESGLSNFHLLTVTEFKMTFQKLQPKIINYRGYKNFDNKKFRSDIWKMNLNTTDWKNSWKQYFISLINFIRANEAPFMTRDLHKAIMKRSKLRNNFCKSRTLSDRKKDSFW